MFGIQLKRNNRLNASRSPKIYSKSDETLFMFIGAYVEVKLSSLLESIKRKDINNQLRTFLEMEGALLSEKSYNDFNNACKVWLPKVCPFKNAFIVFYNEKGIF